MRKIITIESAKSYATEKNLLKVVNQLLEDNSYYAGDRAYIVRTPEGRWTAIFQMDMSKGGYVCRYSSQDFYSV